MDSDYYWYWQLNEYTKLASNTLSINCKVLRESASKISKCTKKK